MVIQCLICKAKINQMHMGIDACRNCAVFYRRNARAKCAFKCKWNKGKCVQEGRVVECRKCRFEFMRSIFERAKSEMPQATVHSDTENSDPMESHFDLISPPEHLPSPSQTSNRSADMDRLRDPDVVPSMVVRIRHGYDAMSRSRKLAELCLRPADKFVHPIDIDNNSFVFLPATHQFNISTNQIFLSSLFDFASIAFPEFLRLEYSDKWQIINDCAERVNSIECIYRSAKTFPDDERIFLSYTTTVSPSSVKLYLSDCPTNVDVGKVSEKLRSKLEENTVICKRMMCDANPTEEEFLMLLGFSFWNSDTLPDEERFREMAISHRAQIMHDMHLYYSSRGIHNYSLRIGELLCLLIANQRFDQPMRQDLQRQKYSDSFNSS